MQSGAATVRSSSSLASVSTNNVGAMENGLIESVQEDSEMGWLFMVADSMTIEQLSMDGAHSLVVDSGAHVHVCPKSYATRAALQSPPEHWRGLDLRSASGKMLKVWGMREVAYNALDLHGRVFTVKIPFVVCEVRRPLLSLAMLEDKGFHMTVKDGCRKLGGHGREVNLRRQGNSYLVDVEFRGVLLERKKEIGFPPGLVTLVDSGVAGLSDTAGVDERRAVTIATPEALSREAVESHMLTHNPFAPWCRACISGGGREAPHFRQGGEETVATPVISPDYFFLGLTDSDGSTTYSLGLMVPMKGLVPYAVRGVCVFLQELGYTRMVLKSDGEQSITALVTVVQKEWAGDSNNFQRQLIPRTSLVDDHASNGAVKAMVHSLEGPTRTSKVGLEEALGVSILPTSPILPWLVRHQSYLRNRFVVRSSGRTPFQELTMSKFQSPLLNFAEAVLAKESGAQEGKLGSPWDLGIRLGRSTRTDEHLVGTRVDGKETS